MTRLTKLTNLKGVCLFVGLLICISSFGIGRPVIPKTNWENSMGRTGSGMCIEILPDNILIIHFSVAVAVPNIEDYPPLLIDYNWGGYETGTWGPIMNNDLIPADIGSIPGYEAHFTVVIDLEPLCPDVHNSGPTPFSFSFDLITNNVGGNSNALLYPVLDYPDVFPLAMFDELSDPDFTPEYAGDKELCCVELADGRSENASNGNYEPILNNTELIVDLFPNPAKNMLNINMNLGKDSRFRIDLLDINGRVIKSVSKDVHSNGDYKEKIDITDLPSGLYFCRINSENITETRKVIKL